MWLKNLKSVTNETQYHCYPVLRGILSPYAKVQPSHAKTMEKVTFSIKRGKVQLLHGLSIERLAFFITWQIGQLLHGLSRETYLNTVQLVFRHSMLFVRY